MIALNPAPSSPLGQKSEGLDRQGDGLNQFPMVHRFSFHLSVHPKQDVAAGCDVNVPALDLASRHTRHKCLALNPGAVSFHPMGRISLAMGGNVGSVNQGRVIDVLAPASRSKWQRGSLPALRSPVIAESRIGARRGPYRSQQASPKA